MLNLSHQQSRNTIMMFSGMMLVALNLRPTLISVGPVLKTIGDSLSLSSIGQGVLTTLPGLQAPRLLRAITPNAQPVEINMQLGFAHIHVFQHPSIKHNGGNITPAPFFLGFMYQIQNKPLCASQAITHIRNNLQNALPFFRTHNHPFTPHRYK